MNVNPSQIQNFTRRDLQNIINLRQVNSRLPEALTITMPGADKELLEKYALALRHDGFGTEVFPMFYGVLKNQIQDVKRIFMEGYLTLKDLESLEDSIGRVAQVMQRATVNIRDFMTMLFGSIAVRNKDED